MTKKHFIALAGVIGTFIRRNPGVRGPVLGDLLPALALTLHNFNPAFDEARFRDLVEEVAGE